jgi:imidazoleglycerol-phosphate dehydratase/histidinol-phosphatase
MKKSAFIDRDGTMVLEPEGYQLDSLDKLEFYPKAFQYLAKIAKRTGIELVVTNQDGLGTDSFRKILLAYAKFYFKGFRK